MSSITQSCCHEAVAVSYGPDTRSGKTVGRGASPAPCMFILLKSCQLAKGNLMVMKELPVLGGGAAAAFRRGTCGEGAASEVLTRWHIRFFTLKKENLAQHLS